MRKWTKGIIALILVLCLTPLALALELSQADIDYLNSLIEDGLPTFGYIVIDWPDEELPLTLTTQEICTTWKVRAAIVDGTEIDATELDLSKEATFSGYNKFEYVSDGATVTGEWSQEDQYVNVTLDEGGEMVFAFNYQHEIELVEDTTTYVFERVDKMEE